MLFVLFVLSGKPLTSIEDSDVYRMLQEDHETPHEPRQSGSFKALQGYIESDGQLLELCTNDTICNLLLLFHLLGILLSHSSRVPGSFLSLGYYQCRACSACSPYVTVSVFVPLSKRWIVYSKLPVYVKVHTWCPAMDRCPIWDELMSLAHCSSSTVILTKIKWSLKINE